MSSLKVVGDEMRDWLEREFGQVDNFRIAQQMIKITEENGELAEAIHNFYDCNPRKSKGSFDNVLKEAGDVIISVAVLLSMFDCDADLVFRKRALEVIERISSQ